MYAHINLVVVLINDAYHLLITVADRHTDKPGKLSYAEVNVHDIVARLHFLQLLHRQCHFSAACRVRAQAVFMEAVEYLMVGKQARPHVVVYKACMEGIVHGCEIDARRTVAAVCRRRPFIEDVTQAQVLLAAVGKHIQPVASQHIVFKSLGKQFEVLMEQRLRLCRELQHCIWHA